MPLLRGNPPRAAAVLIIAGFALPAGHAFAQTSGSGSSDFPDLVPVAAWTAVVVVLALLVTSIGYLYRRKRGLDHPLHAPPPGMDLDHGRGTENPLEPTAGHAVTPHEVSEHAVSRAADVV